MKEKSTVHVFTQVYGGLGGKSTKIELCFDGQGILYGRRNMRLNLKKLHEIEVVLKKNDENYNIKS